MEARMDQAGMEQAIGPPAGRSKRVALAALMALIALNVWTGGPLLSLWLGAQLQRRSDQSLLRPSTAIVVFVSLAIISVALVKLLGVVAAAYDRAAGTKPRRKGHDSWVSVERKVQPGERPSLTTLERILVVVVVMAALTFEVWFFFFSTSPID